MVKAIVVPGGAKMSRKETDALAEWAKGFGAKGLAVTKIANGALDTGVAKFLAPIAAKLIERTGARDGDLLAFAADKPKVVHKVLGELRLKMARDLKIAPSKVLAWSGSSTSRSLNTTRKSSALSRRTTRSRRRWMKTCPSWKAATAPSSSRSRARRTTSS